MPKLKRAEDGHWYIRAWVFAAGHLGTWQVADEGLEYLRRRGYAEGEIPAAVFSELCERNWAYTGGSGFGDQGDVNFLPAKGAEKQLKIGITETEQGWILEILIPELPGEVFTELLRKMKHSQLGKCSLRIDGERESLPITRLWPGKGGVRWPVDPHEGSYDVALLGAWPSGATVNYLTNAIDALDATGTLFFGSSKLGMRLPRGMALSPDDTYYLVLRKKHSDQVRMPPGVVGHDMGSNNGWQAWEIRLVSQPDDTAKRWFARFGASIEEPKLQLDVVSPPPKAILVTGLPMFEVGDQVVIAAEASAPRMQLDHFGVVVLRDGVRQHEVRTLRIARAGERVYWSFSVGRPGTYQVRALKGRVVPLTFAVRGRAADRTESRELLPRPLSVEVCEQSYAAFGGESVEDRIDVWIGKSETPPTVKIHCAAVLEVVWTMRGTTQRRIVESSEAAELLTHEVARVLVERKAMTVDLDASSFGRLSFLVAPEELRISEGRRTIAAMALHRARWLAATVEWLRKRSVREVGVDNKSRAALGELAGYPGCNSLGKVVTIPAEVAPHARALSRDLALSAALNETRRNSAKRS
jgi:hypothetical protein